MSSFVDEGPKSFSHVPRTSSLNAKRRRKKKSRSSDRKSNARYFVSSIGKQLKFYEVTKIFGEWPSWQKRVLLCQLTERTPSSLLSTLSTVLEPVFHRDFEVMFKNGFHSSLIKTFLASNMEKQTDADVTGNESLSLPSVKDTTNPGKAITLNQQNNQKSIASGLLQSQGMNDKNLANQILLRPLSIHDRKDTDYWDRLGVNKYISSSSDIMIANDLSKLHLQERDTLHSHAMKRNADSISTIEFLKNPRKENLKRLGNLMKPSANESHGKCVREYKHCKWWLPPISNSKHLKQASKAKLLISFKEESHKFVQEYVSWSNAEKGDFMLHIVDHCKPDEIMFLATCIYERLAVINSINNVSDKVLLDIFSYLNANDVKTASGVCRRWKKLSSQEYIWKRKCYDLAYQHGQHEVLTYLESSSMELDWKHIYSELEESIVFLECKMSVIDLADSVSSLDRVKFEDNVVSIHEKEGSIMSNNNLSTAVSEDGFNDIDYDEISRKISQMDEQLEIFADDGILKIPETNKLEDGKMSKLESFADRKTSKVDSVLKDGDEPDPNVLSTNTSISKSEEVALKEDCADSDVALDVRGRLIQADNQMKSSSILNDMNYNQQDEYQLIPVDNLRSVKRVRKLEGHSDAVLCLQFDSKRVITGSADRTVRLWDIRSGRFFHCLNGHQGGVHCLKFDDRYIVTGSWDTTVMVWDVIYFILLCTITEHSACVSCLEMNSDILITGSYDTTICIFKKHSWKHLSKLVGHEAPVSCMTLISTTELLTGSHDRKLILWDLNTYSILRKFEGSSSPCLSVKVCGMLIAAGASDGSISFWNLTNSNIEGTIQAHSGNVNALCFVESRFFSAGADSVVKEWDLATCTCLRSLRGHKGHVQCLRASSKRIVSGSADRTVRIWDLACKLQQIGGNYDELNQGVIPTQILNEHQYKNMAFVR